MTTMVPLTSDILQQNWLSSNCNQIHSNTNKNHTTCNNTHYHPNRNMGASMAQLVRGCTMVLLSSMVPTIINTLGLDFLFFFHGAVCATAAIFVWKFVPETRGKTLLQLCTIYSTSSERSFRRGSENQPSTISSNISHTSSMSNISGTFSESSKNFQNSALVEQFSSMETHFDSSKSV